jgi:hypothetical protein
MRPYPAQVMRELLTQVAEKGNPDDAARAKEYLHEITQNFTWHAELGLTARVEGSREYGDGYAELQAGGWLTENAHLEWRFRGIAMDNTDGFVLPGGVRTDVDIFDTWADITVKGRKLNLRQSQNVSFSLGDSDLYFQAGIMRNSFGPFWGDGVVLSADAPHAGHYSVVWRNDRLSYSTALLEIAATNYLRPQDDQAAAVTDKFPNKHLAIQSLNFYITDWLEAGYFESIVWGGRMDLTYLLPFKELFYAQSMAGFEDNSFVGFLVDIRAAKNVKIPLVVYLDDTNLNDLLKFEFGTKFKTATQVGVQWTPDDLGILKRIAADYVIVTPYMYTHRSGLEAIEPVAGDRLAQLSQPNYNNYTHMGSSLGVGLDPNSDRISLQALFEPRKDLRVTLIGRLIRHANASADMIDPDPGGRNDGSIFDDGYNKEGNATFHYKTKFLNQKPVEMTFQGGFQAEYSFKLGSGAFLLQGGYLLEHIRNKNLQKGVTGTNHYFNAGFGYRY